MREFEGMTELVLANRTRPTRIDYDYEPTEDELNAVAGCLLGFVIGCAMWVVFVIILLIALA